MAASGIDRTECRLDLFPPRSERDDDATLDLAQAAVQSADHVSSSASISAITSSFARSSA